MLESNIWAILVIEPAILRDQALAKLLIIDDLPIRIATDGQWLHGDDPVHPKVAILFSKSVYPLEDGNYELRVGPQKAPVLVADCAFFVRSLTIARDESGALTKIDLCISDEHNETLEPSTLMMSEENVLYCRIERHGFSVPCRFLQRHYYEIVELSDVEGDEAFIQVGEQRFELSRPYQSSPEKL